MKLRDKLLRGYLFRVTPGSEDEVVHALRKRLSTWCREESWAFFSWFGRFDLFAVSETSTLFGRDAFLFSPQSPGSVLDVAEVVMVQTDLDQPSRAPSLSQVLLADHPGVPSSDAEFVSLTFLKLDHERLLDPEIQKALRRSGCAPDGEGAGPFGWATLAAAMGAVRLVADRLSSAPGMGAFAAGVGGGLGDCELVVACRFAIPSTLFAFLDACTGISVGDLLPHRGGEERTLSPPLFVSTFSQVGIDYASVEAGFARDDYGAVRLSEDDAAVSAVLLCSGPTGRMLPSDREVFREAEWEHGWALGPPDDILYSRAPAKAGEVLRDWVKFRRGLRLQDWASSVRRTELTLVRPNPPSDSLKEFTKPAQVGPFIVDEYALMRYMDVLQSAPQEVRAVEHILERCALLEANVSTRLALIDFLPYFSAVRREVGRYADAAQELVKLSQHSRAAAELGRKNVQERVESLGAVEAAIRRLDREADSMRDDQARSLRKLTDTVRLFDVALAQRVGLGAEDLLTAGFGCRGVSHMGSLVRLVMSGSYLAHSVYAQIRRVLGDAHRYGSIQYEGFIVYCRDNEAWSFSLDICQLPHSTLWDPADANILLHEIGHQLASKVELDAELIEAVRSVASAGIFSEEETSGKSPGEILSGVYRDLSNLWADLFWCASTRGLSEQGAKGFLQDRLAWMARRQYRYTLADLRRSIGRQIAIVACCGLMQHCDRDTPLEALSECYPIDAAVTAVTESVDLWRRQSGRGQEPAPSWMVRGATDYLTNPSLQLRVAERYREALIMCRALWSSRDILDVLDSCSATRHQDPIPEDDWENICKAVEAGRVPGARLSPRQLGVIPQMIVCRLDSEGLLADLKQRLAVCLWFCDLYCREVLTPRWAGLVPREDGVHPADAAGGGETA